MKRKIFYLIIVIAYISICDSTEAQIKVNSSGKTAIGTVNPSSSYPLIVGTGPTSNAIEAYGFVRFETMGPGMFIDEGPYYDLEMYPMSPNYCNLGRSDLFFRTVYANDFVDPSDLKIKENIRGIDNALDKVLRLDGVQYDLKKEYAYRDTFPMSSSMIEKLERERKNYYGFIAQDVEKILPSVVMYDDSVDMYSLNYIRIIPVIVSAMQEQQGIIDSLIQEVNEIKSENTKGETITNISDNSLSGTSLILQNTPNPFNLDTKVRLYIDNNSRTSMLYVYDLQGKQIKSYQIDEKGNTSVMIKGYELDPGMYLYSLVVDGKEIGTKKMILTE